MTRKIVCDSAANLICLEGADFACVPLKIVTEQAEYVDDAHADVMKMVADLKLYKGRSSSSCPGVGDWLEAFGDAEEVFCLTISGNLSGSFNAARLARDTYEQEHPGRQVYVMDSLSAGPEMAILAEKLRELLAAGYDFETVRRQIRSYRRMTHLVFSLESLNNLANNGRVKPAIAKLTGLLGIRLIGKASVEGTLEPTDKARGEKKALESLVQQMMSLGYAGGRVIIDHCCNAAAAAVLQQVLRKAYPTAVISVRETRCLCSFYAEQGGLLVGFEA